MQFAQQRHVPTIVFPTRLDLPAVITPRVFWSYCRSVPRRRLMPAPAAGEQQERENWEKPIHYQCGKVAMRSRCSGSGFAQLALAVSNENQAHSGGRTGLACKISPATATNQKNSDEMRAATRPRLHALPPPEKAQRSVWFSRWRTAGEIFSHKTTGIRRSRPGANRSISKANRGRAKFESCFPEVFRIPGRLRHLESLAAPGSPPTAGKTEGMIHRALAG